MNFNNTFLNKCDYRKMELKCTFIWMKANSRLGGGGWCTSQNDSVTSGPCLATALINIIKKQLYKIKNISSIFLGHNLSSSLYSYEGK